MGRELTAPSERLIAAAQVAAATFFSDEKELYAIDVGCDHAKLAIYLIQSGICARVLATDIGNGPIEKAREAVARRKFRTEPLDRYITVRQNDGLCGMENERAERIFILGMGGELIASILEKAAFLHTTERKTVCILQAMTDEAKLRRYLYASGFEIVRERLVRDKGRIYSILACRYDGKTRCASDALLAVGAYHAENPHAELFLPYIDRKIRIAAKALAQKSDAGMACEKEKAYLEELQSLRQQGEKLLNERRESD